MADLDERVTEIEQVLEKLKAYARSTVWGRALLRQMGIE